MKSTVNLAVVFRITPTLAFALGLLRVSLSFDKNEAPFAVDIALAHDVPVRRIRVSPNLEPPVCHDVTLILRKEVWVLSEFRLLWSEKPARTVNLSNCHGREWSDETGEYRPDLLLWHRGQHETTKPTASQFPRPELDERIASWLPVYADHVAEM